MHGNETSERPVLHILYLRNNSRYDKEDYDFNHKIRRDHHNLERCLTAKGRPVKSRSERNLNPDLCKTSAVRYHRSYTVNWELAVTWVYDRELKKLRRQLKGKRLIKIELCVKLSLLRLFHVDHVVQNRRSALSRAWHEWFSCKGKEGKIYRCELPLSSEPQNENFPSSFGRLRQNIAPKSVPHVQHDYFSSFNQSNH